VISFHSLEDRIVKHAFAEAAKAGRVELLWKKPREPGEAEIASNPPSRSAKLRAVQARETTAGSLEGAGS
ncbi:MAG: 16S rRNA (cytosine(1402)-N(4))-methyltransferase, partial [Rectinemataceae bacterium]